ncbi:MAG TPA: AsmA-like C-terminal domain-containing protein [Stellaceae bacterium]|nr:AsmA-like C-terminal domain-containing protein [Stellaceae bacterium]
MAGLAIALVAVGWRLERGPISLDFLTPWMQQALSAPEQGITVVVEHTELSLDTSQHTLDLLADGVHLRRNNGSAEVVLPRVALSLSLRAALGGLLAPTRIVLISPQLRLQRAVDGTIHLDLGGGSGGEDIASGLLEDFEARPNRRSALGYLQSIAIRNANFTLDDRALGIIWQAKRADAALFRGDQGISGDAQVTIVAGDQEASVHAEFRYIAAERRLAGSLDFSDVEPARFAAAAPALAPLAAAKIPVSGRSRFSLDIQSMHIDGARADITIGAGTIDNAGLAGGTLPVSGGTLKVDYDPAAARLMVEELTLDLGGPEVTLSARIDGVDPTILRGGPIGRLAIDGDLALRRVPADALDRYWPPSLSPSSRSWVTEHIRDGVADETKAHVSLAVDLSPGAVKPVQVETLQGSIAYHNLTVDYFPPLTPVKGVNGTGSFDRAHFDFLPTSGTLAGLKVTGGDIDLTKLDTNDETIAVNVNVVGPLSDALAVIDSKPLRYAHGFGIDPAKASGVTDQKLFFRFPLLHDLKIDQVEFGDKATIKNGAVAGIAFGHDLTDGDLTLDLDRNALRLQGTAAIDQVPASLSWVQSLKGDGVRRYTLKARLDDAARKRLDVDFLPDILSGPVGVDLVYDAQKTSADASLALDLTDAAVTVSRLNIDKPAGTGASAQLKLSFVNDRLAAIPEALVQGPGIDASLALALVPATGDISRIDVQRLVAGNTDLKATIERQPAGGWAANVSGRSLDASKLVTNLGHGQREERETPLSITAKLDRVILGPDREARQLGLRFVNDGLHWQTVVVDGAFSGGGTLAVRFGEKPGDRNLRVTTDNLGALLKLLDVSDNVVGGNVVVEGPAVDRGEHRVFSGKVEGGDYKIVRASLLARILSLASFSAIGSMLQGEGIPFTRISGTYTYEDGTLKVKDGRTYGGAIGINVGGTMSLRDDNIDLAGTLVPAYTINSLLGKVPVLGPLLLGGEGQGIFGANFRITGPTSDPKISVDALSALAPGALRKLFQLETPGTGEGNMAPVNPPPTDSGEAAH